jgi:hypothetical protein
MRPCSHCRVVILVRIIEPSVRSAGTVASLKRDLPFSNPKQESNLRVLAFFSDIGSLLNSIKDYIPAALDWRCDVSTEFSECNP